MFVICSHAYLALSAPENPPTHLTTKSVAIQAVRAAKVQTGTVIGGALETEGLIVVGSQERLVVSDQGPGGDYVGCGA